MRYALLVLLIGCGSANVEPPVLQAQCATGVFVGDDIAGHWAPGPTFTCDTWGNALQRGWKESDRYCWCHPDNLREGGCLSGAPCMVERKDVPLWGEVQ